MSIDFKDEYASLRQEILDRFSRIHDTAKYGIGAFIAFLSYYYTHSDFDDFFALIILQLLVALIGFSCLNLFRHIYRIGTYIAVVIEHDSKAKWYRMSRQLNEYKKEYDIDKTSRILPFPLGTRWGEDPAQIAILLAVLMFVGLATAFSHSSILKTSLSSLFIHPLTTLPSLCASQRIICIIAILLVLCNLVILVQLWLVMGNCMRKSKKTWKEYNQRFVSGEFPDEYK